MAEAGLDRKMVSLFLFPSFPIQHYGCLHLVQDTILVGPNLWPEEDTSVPILTKIHLLKTSYNFSHSNLAEATSAPCPEKDVVAALSQALSCL